jgi:DNA-binding MarR family transcriptional regulator
MEELLHPSDGVRIFHALKVAHQTARTAIDADIEDLGLTAQQFLALFAVAKGAKSTNAELARESFISPQAMITTIATLEARGLIRRAPRRGGGRSLETRLTVRGKELLSRALAHARAIERYARDVVGEKNFEILMSSLHVWIDAMAHAAEGDARPWERYLAPPARRKPTKASQ